MNDINDLIKLVASIDRRTLFFVDNYTGEDVYPYELRHDPNGFSHGGNVWQLINSFRELIITGKCGDLRECMKIHNKRERRLDL